MTADVYRDMGEERGWNSPYSSNAYSVAGWDDADHPYRRGSADYYPLYERRPPSAYTGAVFRRDGSTSRSLIAPEPGPSLPEEPFNALYDFNDITHSYYGLDDSFQEAWPSNDNFWVNVPQQSFQSPSSRSIFGLSDSIYLDPLDVDGMNSFNSSTGIYAPKLSSTPISSSLLSPKSPGPHDQPIDLPMSLPNNNSARSAPPVHLSQLWSLPLYQSIWDHFQESKRAQLLSLSALEDPGDTATIKRRIDQGIQEKKFCHITKARTIFVELVVEYSMNVQVWLEFCRLEMECGEYKNARVVLEAACEQHPHNELLLQKRLRVEERLRCVNNVIMIINELCLMDTQKSMKIMVEGIGILAKLGYEKMAFMYGKNISTTSKYFTGNLYLEMMLAEQRSGSMSTLTRMIDDALVLFPKYGPLWFFCFNLTEHFRQLQWDKVSMMDLISVETMEKNAELARGSLTADILWKVFLLRVEFWYRTCMFLRQFTFDNVSHCFLVHS